VYRCFDALSQVVIAFKMPPSRRQKDPSARRASPPHERATFHIAQNHDDPPGSRPPVDADAPRGMGSAIADWASKVDRGVVVNRLVKTQSADAIRHVLSQASLILSACLEA